VLVTIGPVLALIAAVAVLSLVGLWAARRRDLALPS
jgi:hypothetical protein